MATLRRRKNTWQVQIRRQGHAPLSRTFRLRTDGELWARQTEAELDRGGLPVDSRQLRSNTLADLLKRYAAEVVPRKRSADREAYTLRVILRHPIARVSLHRLTATEIAKYRDDRLSLVKGDTVRRELAIVRHCLEVARNEWGFVLPTNPVQLVKLPRAGNPRERRANPGELEQLLAACETLRCRWLPAIIQLAVETGMRRSELLAMRWEDVDVEAHTILLRNTKNGRPRMVPLSTRALNVIMDTPRCGPTVFTISANALRLAWQRLRRQAGVSELRFHDLRHEAVSRFFEKGLNVPEVALISGHRDPRMLFRYTHPKAEDIAAKLRR
jgi:integrase